jgi:hypothetical protein
MSLTPHWLRAALAVAAAALLGVSGPCAPAAAPSAASAVLDPEISAGAEGPEGIVAYRGSALFVSALLIHPDWPSAAASANPIPLSHPVDWSRLVRFELTRDDGTLVSWPLVAIPAAAPSTRLDRDATSTLLAFVSPSDTSSLSAGLYRVSAVLDASAVTQAGAYQGVVTSAATRFELRDPIASPTAAQAEALEIFDARYRILIGDSAAARTGLEALVARQPSSLLGLTLLSDLERHEGALDRAAVRLAEALSAWRAIPDPSPNRTRAEPPEPLLQRQRDLANTRLRLASGDARPALSARISAKAPSATPDVIEVDVTFTNDGAATALDARVVAIKARTLQGVGNVALDAALGPALPLGLGTLGPGAATTVRLPLRVDPGVVRFALTEDGAVDADFGTFGFTLTQATYK